MQRKVSQKGSSAPRTALALLAKIHSELRSLPCQFLWRVRVGTSNILTSSFENSAAQESEEGTCQSWLGGLSNDLCSGHRAEVPSEGSRRLGQVLGLRPGREKRLTFSQVLLCPPQTENSWLYPPSTPTPPLPYEAVVPL